MHPRFVHNGTGEIPSWGGEGISPDPAQKSPVAKGARPDGSTRLSICKEPKRNATICDPKLRTMNIDAPCGSPVREKTAAVFLVLLFERRQLVLLVVPSLSWQMICAFMPM
eukprot:COSAG06_NODE_1307_length_9916_cov_99.462361_3_plen_111_part_00